MLLMSEYKRYRFKSVVSHLLFLVGVTGAFAFHNSILGLAIFFGVAILARGEHAAAEEEWKHRHIKRYLEKQGLLERNGTQPSLDLLLKDRDRLNWLIDNGFTPAIWRQPKDEWEYRNLAGSNHQVYVGRGTRDEIDAAMERSKRDFESRAALRK